MAIIVNQISKSFAYYEKEAGLKSSITNLFYRKKLYKQAVNDISFTIDEGEFVGFLGPNGAGKTTTLKMLAGILHPTSGSAEVHGYTPWKREKKFKLLFSIVMGQKSQLSWDLPANESLILNKYIYEIDQEAFKHTVEELTDLLDVKHLMKIQVRRLSLGERMKFELIAALLHQPKVLLLDEPTIGLDIISQTKIRSFLKFYNEQAKATIMLTSHYMNDIEKLCKRTIIINNGSKIYDGELAQINRYMSLGKVIKVEFSKVVALQDLLAFGEVKEYEGYKATISMAAHDLKHMLGKLLAEFPIVDFSAEDTPLELGIARMFEEAGQP